MEQELFFKQMSTFKWEVCQFKPSIPAPQPSHCSPTALARTLRLILFQPPLLQANATTAMTTQFQGFNGNECVF